MSRTIQLAINKTSYSCTFDNSNCTRQCGNRFKVRQKFYQVLIPQFLVEYISEKNYENRSIFDSAITKINLSHFLWPTVYQKDSQRLKSPNTRAHARTNKHDIHTYNQHYFSYLQSHSQHRVNHINDRMHRWVKNLLISSIGFYFLIRNEGKIVSQITVMQPAPLSLYRQYGLYGV